MHIIKKSNVRNVLILMISFQLQYIQEGYHLHSEIVITFVFVIPLSHLDNNLLSSFLVGGTNKHFQMVLGRAISLSHFQAVYIPGLNASHI